MEKSTPSLPAHEWAAVTVFITILSLIVILNFFVNKRDPYLTLPAHSTDEIFVSVEGAVTNHGSIKVKKGARLGDVINISGPLQHADLSEVNRSKILKEDQMILIPDKKMITVFLEGDITPRGAYQVEKGTTMQQLYRQLSKEISLTKRQDRVLKNEEVVKIEKK
jgi:cell division protein YceG involved in septum cleavage